MRARALASGRGPSTGCMKPCKGWGSVPSWFGEGGVCPFLVWGGGLSLLGFWGGGGRGGGGVGGVIKEN